MVFFFFYSYHCMHLALVMQELKVYKLTASIDLNKQTDRWANRFRYFLDLVRYENILPFEDRLTIQPLEEIESVDEGQHINANTLILILYLQFQVLALLCLDVSFCLTDML